MLGLAYFTAVSEDELQALENTLADLKKKRYMLAVSVDIIVHFVVSMVRLTILTL